MINWKLRIKNPAFWLALIPAVLLTIQAVLAPFGITWDYSILNDQLIAIVNAVFGLLAVLGVVVDMTTAGISDSQRAMGYDDPYKDVIVEYLVDDMDDEQ